MLLLLIAGICFGTLALAFYVIFFYESLPGAELNLASTVSTKSITYFRGKETLNK